MKEYLLGILTYILCIIFGTEGIKLLERLIFSSFIANFIKNSKEISSNNILAV
jgi:hypothetical protein